MHLAHQFGAALGEAVAAGLGRVDDDQQLAGPRGLRAGVLLPVELEREVATGQRCRQQFDHHRQRRTFMPAEGQQGTSVQNFFGVLRRLAMLVDPHARRQAVVLARGNLHIAVGNGAGGQVEYDRVAPSTGCGKSNRVGAKQRLLGAMGDYAGHAVDHTQRHQPFFGKWLDIRPECCEVMGVADRQHCNPGAAGLFHQQFTRRCQRRLGKAIGRIDADKARGHVFYLRHGLAVDPVARQ